MTRVLVTGGAGFIGSHLVDLLLAEGADVSVLDNLKTGRRKNLPSHIRLIEGTIVDRRTVERAVAGAEVIFHLAAYTSVDASFRDPAGYISVNDLGLVHLVTSARRAGVRKIVFASSSAVYDGESEEPRNEGERPRPLSPYALTKLDGECLLSIFDAAYGLPWVALRFFNVFGPRQMPLSDYADVIPTFIDRALRHEDLVIFGDGRQTRDFVYVEDVARAAAAAASRGSGVYNIGAGRALSVLDLARLIIDGTGSRSSIVFDAPRLGDVRHSTADISRARAELQWAPRVPISDGLARTVEWFHDSYNGMVGGCNHEQNTFVEG